MQPRCYIDGVEFNATIAERRWNMTNTDLLREKIEDSGMTVVAIAKKAGIKRETLYNKMSGRSEFTASEMVALSRVLRLTMEERDAIFFAQMVE